MRRQQIRGLQAWARAAAMALAAVASLTHAGADAPAPKADTQGDAAEMERARAELRRAQEELARAAREMARAAREAEIASPRAYAYEFVTDPDRAMLGVTVADDKARKGTSPGVLVTGVTPGSGADKAGLKSGDLLISANGTTLAGDAGDKPVLRLRDVMASLKPGDKVKLDYERDGRRATVIVIASRPHEAMAPLAMFGWRDDDDFDVLIPPAPPVPPVPGVAPPAFEHADAGLQLARIDDDLASYFKTKDGVLVVRAPGSGTLGLKSGDVIRKINGRSVASPVAAWEELADSEGRSISMDVVRLGKTMTLDGELPGLGQLHDKRRIVIRHRVDGDE